MKGQMCFGLVALLEVLVSVLAADRQTYVAVGDPLSLMPPEPSSGPIKNIMWKCNGNLVLDWVEGKVDLEFYGTFRGRSKLDTTNAHLEVKDMTKDDSGIYSPEINNQELNDRYDVKVIRAVPVPEVTTRPLTCGTGSDKDKCTLACNGIESITEAEPITYSWKSDSQMLQVNTSTLLITNDEKTRRVKTYSCKMKNPVSEKESKAHDNPFFKEEQTNSGLITYVAVGDTLSLMPPEPSSGPIKNIMWKCNGNLVLDWVEGKVDLEFYGTFRGRSKLDTTNAHLEVKDMTKDDSGIYSPEINNQIQNDRYDVKVIRPVPVPEVTTRPLTCGTGSDKDKCTLACNGFESITEAEPITYSWKSDGQMLQDTTANLIITNDEETRRVKTYSCKMKNPVSEEESKAHNNPFFTRS